MFSTRLFCLYSFIITAYIKDIATILTRNDNITIAIINSTTFLCLLFCIPLFIKVTTRTPYYSFEKFLKTTYIFNIIKSIHSFFSLLILYIKKAIIQKLLKSIKYKSLVSINSYQAFWPVYYFFIRSPGRISALYLYEC